jgi:hypothetical protein
LRSAVPAVYQTVVCAIARLIADCIFGGGEDERTII